MQAHDTTLCKDQSMDLRLGYCIHVGAGSMWHYQLWVLYFTRIDRLCVTLPEHCQFYHLHNERRLEFISGRCLKFWVNIVLIALCTARIPASISLHEMFWSDSSMLVGCGYLAKRWLGMKRSTIQYSNIHKFVLLYKKMAKILCQGCLAVSQGKLFMLIRCA